MSCIALLKPFVTLSNNIGMEFGLIIFIVFMIGGAIFYVRNPLIGVILHECVSLLFFIWFYLACWNWAIPLISMLLFFVIWALMILNAGRSREVIV